MKHCRKLGLCAMTTFALMASVGATQASALWLESGTTIAANLEGNIKIVGLEPEKEGGTAGAVHGTVEIPAKELELLCASAKAKDELLLTGTVLLKKTVELTECKTFQKKKESTGCKPSEPIVAKALEHLILHETVLNGEKEELLEKGFTYVLIEPEEGKKQFTTVDFNEETCALPDTEATGTVVAECLGEKYELEVNTKVDYCLQELVNHLLTEAPRKLFTKDILKYGANEMFIKGVLNLFLNTGNKWSGHV